LLKKGGSRGYVIWGVKPADTGHHLNPGTSFEVKDAFSLK